MACYFFTSAASNAVGTLMVDYLVKPIERRLRYLFRFSNIVEELRIQENTLTIEQTQLHRKVEEAKLQIQTQVIEEYVEEWLRNATNALNDVQSLESRIEEKKRCFRWCPNWSWRYRLSKEIEKKTVDINNLVDASKLIEIVGHRAELPGLEFFTSKDLVVSKSSAAAFNKIMEALKDDNLVNMIGVWGMGGVGKTTLVTEVGRKAKELRLFHKVIKVVVSQTPIIENIQYKIADFLDLKFDKTTKEGKAEELWLRLENEEKVLIILDDMWNELNLTEIGLPLDENGKGCKIILTTRNRQVCNSMKSQVTVSIDVLDEDEAWTLFKMNASLEIAHADIIEEAKEVAKECKGLPVAIVTLARALKGTKTRKGWEVARKKLKSSRLMEIGNIEEEEEKNAYMCIKISYEHLKKETTKRCFLLCALYPEDHSIDVEDLVRYSWALELYGKPASIEEVRIQVLAAIDYLKDSCLLLEDKQRYIKLHDIVRDVALWIASKEESDFIIKSSFEVLNESFEPCKAISLLDTEEKKFPEILVCPKLEILLLKNCDAQGTCFQGMQELKVLSLAVAYDSMRLVSLYALTSLGKLRALHLEYFKDFSFLGNLRTLEILSLRGYGSEELADELGRLENLKILDLTKCRFFSTFPSNVIRRLTKLEELYLKDSNIGIKGEARADILLEINFLTRLTALSLEVSSFHFPKDFEFPELERYEISINSESDKPDYFLHAERSLKIERVFPLNVVSKLLGNIESLEVSDMMDEYVECLTDKTQQKVSVSVILQHLKQVRIENCENLKVVFQMENVEEKDAPLLSNLKYLCLEGLSNLSCIWEFPTHHARLEGLVDLRISNCPSLKSLFSVSLAQSLVLLECLSISDCDELKQIVTELEGDEEEISSSINSHTSLCFPKLTSLKITFCDSLEYIFPTLMAPQGLQQLSLFIWNCCQLKQVIRLATERVENDIVLQQLQFLTSFPYFSVSGCPQLTDSVVHLEAVEVCLEEVRLSAFKESFSNSKHLQLRKIEDHNLVPDAKPDGLNGLFSLRLEECKDLECLVDTTTMTGPTSAFTNLVRLFIEDTDGLKTLCKGRSPEGFLQNLKFLEVKNCRDIVSLSPTGKLQNLQQLYVRDCNELQVVFQMDENQEQTLSNLQSLELLCLPELRWVLKGSAHYFSLQSLKVVNINRCSKLKSIFSQSLIQSLVLLEELKIRSCYELKTLFAELENDGETESNSYLPPLRLPKLTTLEIFGCRELEYVLPITLAQGLPALRSISVSCCHELKQVFSMAIEQDGVQQDGIELLGLQALELRLLTNMSSFGPENYFVKAPALESLIVHECPQLMNFTIQQVKKNIELQGVRLSVFKELLCNTKDLTLDRIMDHKNLVPDVDLEHLEGLTSLELYNWEDLECLVDTTQEMIGLKIPCNNQPPKGFLQNLKKLIISSCEKLQEVFRIDDLVYNREENQAPPLLLSNLEYLELEFLPELRWILKVPTHYVNLQSLKVLKIISCQKSKSLFSLSTIQTLRLLEELNIGYCEELESVSTKLESDDDQIESNTLCLPNLKNVEINKCPRLEYVFPLALARGLPCLQKIRLVGLGNLSSFVAGNNFVEAPALEIFDVYDCPRFANFTIQKEVNKCVPLKELNFYFRYSTPDPESCNMVNTQLRQRSPSFEYITVGNFEQLFHLQGGYFISSLEDMIISDLIWLRDIWKGPIQVATNLKALTVHRCHRLTYIFPVMLIRHLPLLSILKIKSCENLEQIVVNNDIVASSSQGRYLEKKMVFPQLKKISLKELSSLESFSPVGYHLLFPCLDFLEVDNCSKMTTSFTVDYSTLAVHTKTDQAPLLDGYISWERRRPTSLPPYVEEEAEEISPLK